MNYPKSLEDLVIEFMKYPGIGRKTAERYAMFTVNHLELEDIESFQKSLINVKQLIHPCPTCFHLTDHELCEICSNPQRDRSRIMVVESATDVFSIEKSKTYFGMYHVLGGALSPMNGIGPSDLHLTQLWKRVEQDEVKEVILATSGTQEGEYTAMYIKKVLENTDVLVTRIGYGVPVGSNLEYADDQTLLKAIENRRIF